MKNRKPCLLPHIVLTMGLLAAGHAHADRAPSLWGPRAVSPASLHVPEGQHGVAAESFQYVSLHPVLFNSGKATISSEGQKALDAAADYLLKHGNIQRVLVEGNTDYIGNGNYNDRLSERRSEMVRNYLTLKGVDSNLLVLSGRGETTPVDQNWSRDGRQRNRHVALYVLHWQHENLVETGHLSAPSTPFTETADEPID